MPVRCRSERHGSYCCVPALLQDADPGLAGQRRGRADDGFGAVDDAPPARKDGEPFVIVWIKPVKASG